MILLHGLVPGVDPLSEMVGAYLATEYRWLSRLTFLALGCALGSLGLGLILYQIPGRLFAIAMVFAFVAVVGFIGVATVPDFARNIAVPTQPATVISILLLSLCLKHQPPWVPVSGYLLFISIVLIALFVFTIVLGVLASAGLGGLANRTVLVLIYVWVFIVARRLRLSAIQ